MSRSSENGDGVRGRIVSSRTGLHGEWTIKTGSIDTPVSASDVVAGETLDFIVDGLASVDSDSFGWNVTLTVTSPEGTPQDAWNSVTDFHGPVTTAASLPELTAFAWHAAYQRLPDAEELESACEFYQQQLKLLASQPDVPGSGIGGPHQSVSTTPQLQ